MLVRLKRDDGKWVAVDHYRVDFIEEVTDAKCVVHTSFSDESKRLTVAHSFEEIMKRFHDAHRSEFDDPKEPWQDDEGDVW